MLEECLEIFKKNLDEDPDMVLRGYIPKDGKYYLVTMKEKGPWEVSPSFKIKYDKKEKKIENQPLNYSFIRDLDFNSNLIVLIIIVFSSRKIFMKIRLIKMQ